MVENLLYAEDGCGYSKTPRCLIVKGTTQCCWARHHSGQCSFDKNADTQADGVKEQ